MPKKPQPEVEFTTLTCAKCQWSWWPRKPKLPKVCPKCKNEKWQGEKNNA